MPVLWCLFRVVEGERVQCLAQGRCLCHGGGEAGLPLGALSELLAA